MGFRGSTRNPNDPPYGLGIFASQNFRLCLQDVKYLVLNSLEGVIQNTSPTVQEQGGVIPAIPGLVGPPPRDTHSSTPGHRDSGAATDEGFFIVGGAANSRAVGDLVERDPSQLTVKG